MSPVVTPETVIVGPFAEVMDQAKQQGLRVRRIAVATDIWESLEGDFAELPRAPGEPEARQWDELRLEHNRYLPAGYVSLSGSTEPSEHDGHRMLFAARRIAAMGGQ